MKITKAQAELFAQQNECTFVRITAEHLRRRHAEALDKQGVKNEAVEDFVRATMVEAEKYGVINEPDIRFYCECKLLLGPKFDRAAETAWAGEILRRKDIDGAQKMSLIEEHMLFAMDEPR